jgi:hypothetical protein
VSHAPASKQLVAAASSTAHASSRQPWPPVDNNEVQLTNVENRVLHPIAPYPGIPDLTETMGPCSSHTSPDDSAFAFIFFKIS